MRIKEILLNFICWMDWHWKVVSGGSDGCSATGRCSHCGDKVLRDSQGNWFSIERDKHTLTTKEGRGLKGG